MADSRQEKIALLTSLAKRRGFIYQSSEIYGGLRGCWDYGPLGAELKKNVKNAWWRSVVTKNSNIFGQDSSIIMHPKVWEASGHLAGFSDPLVECFLTGSRFRPDQLDPESGTVFEFSGAKSTVNDKQTNDTYKVLARNKGEFDKAKKTAREFYSTKRGIEKPELLGEKTYEIKDSVGEFSPDNGGQLSEARNFNLMLKTFLGPAEDSSTVVYLRPETAQGIFVNFANVQQAMRAKIPFGIAQTGKSFRNEITPKNFTFRTREFEQMELQFFCKPGTDEEWHEKWKNDRMQWYVDYGIEREKLRFYEHPKEKLAHYAKTCVDIEYLFPFKAEPEWGELEGIANRTDFDLKTHSEHSGKTLSYFDEETKEHYVPYVIEPSAGADRATLAFLLDAYTVDGEGDEKRTLLKLHPCLAPVKVAVLPLVKKEGMPEIAEKLFAEFLDEDIEAQIDINSSIGKRYARQDEIGTSWCITVDGDTVENGTVTIRDRDSKEQEKVALSEAVNYITQGIKKSRP
jgi:glycyl-tRNA synthetase